MDYIPLSQGGVAVVDDEDYEWLCRFRWSNNGIGYVQAWINGNVVLMHRLVMNAQLGQEVDHINRIKQDNRRCNLRIVSREENMRNAENCLPANHKQRKRSGDLTSRYKGVSYEQRRGRKRRWRMQTTFNGKRVCQYFHNEEDAARAYDAIAFREHGYEAQLNFPRV